MKKISKEWTPEERLRICGKIAERIVLHREEPIDYRSYAATMAKTIIIVTVYGADFLEQNRLQIMKDAAYDDPEPEMRQL